MFLLLSMRYFNEKAHVHKMLRRGYLEKKIISESVIYFYYVEQTYQETNSKKYAHVYLFRFNMH